MLEVEFCVRSCLKDSLCYHVGEIGEGNRMDDSEGEMDLDSKVVIGHCHKRTSGSF